MGISERKEREKSDMKKLIRTAATKMFLEDGYAKTSIRNIAEAIEYSPRTIYLYYKDKDELLYEVQAYAFGELLEVFKKQAASEHPVERLKQICSTYVSFGLAQPELYDLMFIMRAPTNVDEAMHETNGGEAFTYLLDCLTACVEQKLLRINSAEEGALQIWAMAHGMVSLNVRCRLKMMSVDETNLEPVLKDALKNFIKMLEK